MKHCINYKHIEVQELANQTGLHPVTVAAKIAIWQEVNNNYDRFPTIAELNIINPITSTIPSLEEFKTIQDKLLDIFKSLVKQTNNVTIKNNTLFVHDDVDNNNAISTIKRFKDKFYDYIDKEFPDYRSNRFLNITSIKGGYKVDLIVPKSLINAYNLKENKISYQAYLKAQQDLKDSEIEYSDEALDNELKELDLDKKFDDHYSPLDEDKFYDDPFEISNERKAMYAILRDELAHFKTREKPTDEEIDLIVNQYNDIHNTPNSIPDLKDPSVIRELQLLKQDYLKESEELLVTEHLRNVNISSLKDKIKQNDELREFHGRFKPFAVKLHNLITSIEKQLTIVKNNYKDAKSDSSRKELQKRINNLESTLRDYNKLFNEVVSKKDTDPMLASAKYNLSKAGSILLNLKASKLDPSEYLDKLFYVSELLDYWNDVIYDNEGVYFLESDRDNGLNDLLRQKVFDKQFKVTNNSTLSIEEALNDLMALRDTLRTQFLKALVEEDLGEVDEGTYAKLQGFRKHFLSIDTSERPEDQVLATEIGKIQVKIAEAKTLVDNKTKEYLDRLLKKYSNDELFDLLTLQTDHGSRTLELKHKYSQSYLKKYKEINDKIKELYSNEFKQMDVSERIDRRKTYNEERKKFLNDTRTKLNLSILFYEKAKHIDYLNLQKPTQQEIDDEIARAKKELGEKEYNELYKVQEHLIDQYLSFRESELESLIVDLGSIEDFTKHEIELQNKILEIRDGRYYGMSKSQYIEHYTEDVKDNPFVYSQWLHDETVQQVEHDGKTYDIWGNSKFHESVPKKFNKDGTETGFYDKVYEKIESDPDLKGLYDILNNLTDEAKKQLGKEVTGNLLTLAEKTTFQTISSVYRGNFKGILNNLLDALKKLYLLIRDSYPKLARKLGVNKDVFSQHDILTVNKNFESGHKTEIENRLNKLILKEKIKLIDKGYSLDKANSELKKIEQSLKEQIVHELISEKSTDIGTIVSAMNVAIQSLKFKNEALPLLDLYSKSLKQITIGKGSNIKDTNNHGKFKKGNKDFKSVDDNDRYQSAKETIDRFLGYSTDRSIANPEELDSNVASVLFRTFDESKELKELNNIKDKLQSLAEQIEKKFKNKEIDEKEYLKQTKALNQEQKVLLSRLEHFNIYAATGLKGWAYEVLPKSLRILSVTKSLWYNRYNPTANTIGGIVVNYAKAAERGPKAIKAFNKALKVMSRTEAAITLGSSVAGGLLFATLATNPFLMAISGIVGTGLFHRGGKVVSDLINSKNPIFQKVVNAMLTQGVSTLGEELSIPNSDSRIDKLLQGFKPMSALQSSEFLNAATQFLSFLYETELYVIDKGAKKKIDGVALLNQDGSYRDYDGWYNPFDENEVWTKEQLVNFISKSRFSIATNTGNYDPVFSPLSANTEWGKVATMYRKWWFRDMWNTFLATGIKNYNNLDLSNKKNYTEAKAKLATMQDVYGKIPGSLLSGLYLTAQTTKSIVRGNPTIAGIVSTLPIIVPYLTTAVVATTLVTTGIGYYLNRNNKNNPYDLGSMSRLLSTAAVLPVLGWLYEYKAGKYDNVVGRESRKFYSKISDTDRSNLRFVRAKLNSLAAFTVAGFLVHEILLAMAGDDKEDLWKKVLRSIKHINDLSQQNATGAGNFDFLTDLKNGVGLGTTFSQVFDYLSIVINSIGEIIYQLPISDEDKKALGKEIKYQKSRKPFYEEGDSKAWEQLKRNIPSLKSAENLKETIFTKDKK